MLNTMDGSLENQVELGGVEREVLPDGVKKRVKVISPCGEVEVLDYNRDGRLVDRYRESEVTQRTYHISPIIMWSRDW